VADKEVVLALIAIISTLVATVSTGFALSQRTLNATHAASVADGKVREEKCANERIQCYADARKSGEIIVKFENSNERVVEHMERLTKLVEELVYGRPEPPTRRRAG
jgi:hypothetical protein